MDEAGLSLRSAVREVLSLFASEEQQVAYERDVPHVDISAELLCMWADDIYHPDDSWRRHFSPDELAAMAEFHALFDQVSSKLPVSHGTVRTWLANWEWQRIMAGAGCALALISA